MDLNRLLQNFSIALFSSAMTRDMSDFNLSVKSTKLYHNHVQTDRILEF